MTAIARQSAKIFAQNAPVGQVTAFRTTEATPQTTKAPDQIQNENYLQGWLNADGSGNVLPYAEDMNGLFYTLSYNTAYLYEKGIPEYSSTQTYYLNSFCQYSGTIYRCKGDSVINIAPTNTNYWDALPSSSYTATTVGAATSNYGTVYAGTNTAGTQFQFKTIIGGSNVTISETADSLTISSTGGGGGTAITASAPLDLTNNVLSIPAATSSQSGYLTAADWTSFNSKLSSTIFSANNTWTGSNDFGNILPRANNTYTLGSESYAWTEVYTNYLLSNANDHLVIGNTTDNNRVLINYISSGSNWGIFPDTVSGTASYLGNSSYKWNVGHIDTIYSGNLHNTAFYLGSDFVGSYSILLAYNGSLYSDVAYLNYTPAVSGLGFYPPTDDTGTLGVPGGKWAQGWISDISVDTIGAISTSITLNSAMIPASNESQAIGSSTERFDNIYSRQFWVSDTTHIYTPRNDGKQLKFEWRNNSNTARTASFKDDAFQPDATNTIDLGGANNRWKTVYYGTLNPTSDVRLKDNIQDLESGLKIINNLEIKSYTLKNNDTHIEYGVLAQEVVKKHPELVSIPNNNDELYGVYIHNFIFASIKAIQELSAKVDDLQQQLQELKK